MHFHRRQSDLWVAVSGRFQVGLYDLRNGGPGGTFELAPEHPQALLIPPGVAHGFLALSEATLLYMVTEAYDGTDEHGFRFDDPGLGFAWGRTDPVVADRDRSAPPLEEAVWPG
jgi:dTDP-4-dehydrorhamnose 3,5-epimerase